MQLLKFLFPSIGLLLTFQASAFNASAAMPPDTTSTIVDRAAATVLIDEGKQLLTQGKTRAALIRFREAQVKDEYNPKAAYWIGRAHYNLSNFGYALKYAKEAQELSEATDGDVFFLLGESYHRKNELDSARMNYDLAEIQLSRSKKRVYNISKLVDEIAFAQKQEEKETTYERTLVDGGVNSGYDDYGPIKIPEKMELYFISRRPDTDGGGINPDDQRYFEDIYKASWNEEEKVWDSITNELDRLNSIGFDAVGHIADGGNRVYITRNTSVVDMDNQTKGSDIMVAEFTNQGRWSRPKPIKNKTINTSYFDGAPCLTADENTMYFVSDRRGRGHRSDIFVVHKEGRKWGEATVLPDNINTAGNETTPFITPDGSYLFYSSDGFLGMGGYDIYVSKNMGNGEWSDPINLGIEFNSVNNDTHFRYYPELKKAFLASYRLQGSKASIDIFQLLLDEWDIPNPAKEK